MDKNNVAEILLEIGVLLELKGENPFKTRAYGAAARSLETLSEPLAKLVTENRLGEVKGIGDALQKKICELVNTGRLPYYDELKSSFPPGLFALLQIPGLGPKKVKALFENLKITCVEELQKACDDNRVAGFEPHETPLDEFLKAGGSAKCLTLRLDGEEAAVWPIDS